MQQAQAAIKLIVIGLLYLFSASTAVASIRAGDGGFDIQVQSTSTAAISGIAGDKDARTGDREAGIKPIFDADKVGKDINAQIGITQTASVQLPKAIGTYSQSRKQEALIKAQQARAAGDAEAEAGYLRQAANWDEGGSIHVALHTAAGLLMGGAAGGVAAGGTALAAPLLEEVEASITSQLMASGMSEQTAQSTAKGIVSTAVAVTALGASGGNVAAGGTAMAVDANNRQLRNGELALARKYAKQLQEMAAKNGEWITQEEAEARIQRQLLRWVNEATNVADAGKQDQLVTSLIGMKGQDKQLGLSWDYRDYGSKNPSEYKNPNINAENIGKYSPQLGNSNAGLTPEQIASRQDDNKLIVANVAICLASKVGCSAISGYMVGDGINKVKEGDVLGGGLQMLGGTVGIGASLYGPVKAALQNSTAVAAKGGGIQFVDNASGKTVATMRNGELLSSSGEVIARQSASDPAIWLGVKAPAANSVKPALPVAKPQVGNGGTSGSGTAVGASGHGLVPVGEATIPLASKPIEGTTVLLDKAYTMPNGTVIPAGSRVTYVDNAIQVTPADGSASVTLNASTLNTPPKQIGYNTGANNALKSVDDLLKPNGQFVGTVERGATPNIRTLTSQEFSQLQTDLLNGAKPAGQYAGGKGTWYELPTGGRVGVRQSDASGLTLDINIPGFPRDLKVHQK